MPDLTCTVRNCSYNEDEMCSRKAIDVSGGGTRENTCCDSFSTAEAAANSCGCSGEKTSINCDAKDCIYNDDCRCDADQVKVCSEGTAAHCHDTECHTYHARQGDGSSVL